MTDESLYQRIADELEQNKTDRVTWTRALGESGGDIEKTKALYIRLRLAELKKIAAAQAEPMRMAVEPPSVEDHGLQLLRTELAKTLAINQASSFYSVLRLPASASDAAIAHAIAAMEAQIASGALASTPEFKYASETLGNPRLRESYDRKMLERFRSGSTTESRPRRRSVEVEPDNDSVVLSLWATHKTGMIVASVCIAIVGYMLLGFFKEQKTSEVQKQAIDATMLQTNRTADNDATRAQTERILVEGALENQATAIDHTAQIHNRSLDVAERRQRQEMEYRTEMNARNMEMRRQEQERYAAVQAQRAQEQQRMMEERKAANEKRYWTCMNSHLDRMTSAEASARCSSYR
ncbi:hypothetical protein [Candidatus Symbiobacter mobilis]|uniref:Uncharacterized protein n=1 Tax=Candidatus Symbiobacter mobilis CR TaxID=946483 RepID=U5NCM8_9BURK|nr:hypothetical protein [Candidatus Symbiobacter mobilis]AGX87983.1 hypothetical protein Cenrod_1905 [Candidatus Symbiobacter mobilis CR]